MAFRASELRLILGIQAYGTTNLSRLRRDITALGRAVDAANANQLRVQDQIVAKREQVAKVAQRVATMESRAASSRGVIEAQTALAAERFAQRRAVLAQKEISLASQLANKKVQLGKLADRIDTMGGSGMQRFAVQDAQMMQRRIGLQNQLNTLERQGIGLRAQDLRNQAAEIAAARRLAGLAKDQAQFSKLTRDVSAVHALDVTDADQLALKEAALRYHAVATDAERIAAAQKHLPTQVAAVNQQLAVAGEQEKLIQARKFEQAQAIARQSELYIAQEGQLKLINERLEAIKIEEKMITAQEGLTNAQRARSLATLELESNELSKQRVLLGELVAEEQLLSKERMRQAIAADRMNERLGKAARTEVLGRSVAHLGRTMQFTGLIGVAAFGAAGAAAAEFDRNASLAGTQMRDVGGTFQQAAIRGTELQDVILDLSQRFPASANEMADSAYEIFSSMNLVKNGVVDTAQGYQLLETASKMAVAGQVDLAEATSAMITVLNNFDPELQNVEEHMNQVFSIVRFGQMRLSDFAEAMTPLAPVAKTVGLSLLDVGSALSTLTILMKSPQQAAQGLARAIELLQLEPFKKGFHEFGVEVEDTVGRMRPLHQIIKDIAKEFPEVTTGQMSVVEMLTTVSKASGMTKAGIQGTVQARRALAGLITSTELYDNILSNVTTNQGEFNKAFDAMKETPGVQWAIFTNQIRAFAIVVGRAALPYLLELGDWLVRAAAWLQGLIESTDGAVVKWAVFGAAAALVGGTLLSVIGSIVALIANLKLATISFQGVEASAGAASTAAGILSRTLMGLAGIGIIAIPIVLQLIKGGEPGLWDFLGGALSGAAGGAMIGSAVAPGIGTAVGAAVGAVTVPIAIHLIAKFQAPDPSTVEPVKQAWAQYLQAALTHEESSVGKSLGVKLTDEIMDFDEFAKRWQANLDKSKIPKIGEDIARSLGSPKGPQQAKTLAQKYAEALRNINREWIESQRALLDALTGGDKADDAATIAKERARIHEQAWKNMQEKIDQTVKQLGQTYDQFLQMNKQTFGELFQGPMMSGFIGDIFNGINDLLMQFGQTVPVPIALINQDLEMQMANFEKLREGYAELLRRGVPPEVVQEIQKMGLAGLPFIQGLVQASGPEFNKFVQNVQSKQKEIEKYTKIDFEAQLKLWSKYGSDIASEIIGGLSSEAAQATLEQGFRKYVTQLFGSTFQKEMNKEIEEAVKAANEARAAGKAAEKTTEKDRAAAAAAAKRAREKNRPNQQTNKAIENRTNPAPNLFAPTLRDIRTVGAGGTTINNYGDTNNVRADGVHPERVNQALAKNAFNRRTKRR